MKKIDMYYLKDCPFCKKAFGYIEELKAEDPRFKDLQIETIEEEEEKERADAMDYYFVPTFYIDGEKVHEGIINKEVMKTVLENAL